MPRPIPINSCATCRDRKIKCDGGLPVCLKCQNSQKACSRPGQQLKYVMHSADPTLQQLVIKAEELRDEMTQQNQNKDNRDVLEAKSTVTHNSEIALQNPVVAALFQHYIDFLAPWYDLNDSQNLFTTLVPARALATPILFKALIAFSACHKAGTSSTYDNLGAIYHASCVRDLLAALGDAGGELQGDYLAATCLLRSFEILSRGTRHQQHLLGAYAFATSGPIDLSVRGYPQAGTWNYLREEITVALECRRPVRISSPFEFVPTLDMPDDMWANAISHILAKIVNFFFEEEKEVGTLVMSTALGTLAKDVASWRAHLPKSFRPFSMAPKLGNPFPSIWMVQRCHIAGAQYCALAEILLALSRQHLSMSTSNTVAAENDEACIRDRALEVCGLAYTNDNVAARVNAFGPLAFCGRYLTDESHRSGLIDMLLDFNIPTRWPVQPIIQDLQEHWQSIENP